MPVTERPVLWGRELRYVLTLAIRDAGRPVSVAELVALVEQAGFRLERRPGKTVSDALRWEVRKRRVVRAGRARYAAGTMPRSTAWWMRDWVRRRTLDVPT
jgi:hypothetical protein